MSVGGETAHINPNLRHDHDGQRAVHSRDRVQELNRFLERGGHIGELLIDAALDLGNLLVEKVQLSEQLLKHEAVVIANGSSQSLFHIVPLASQAAVRHLH